MKFLKDLAMFFLKSSCAFIRVSLVLVFRSKQVVRDIIYKLIFHEFQVDRNPLSAIATSKQKPQGQITPNYGMNITAINQIPNTVNNLKKFTFLDALINKINFINI